ncbi:hydroxymethylglutaryl-CoA lyase [Pseudomonas stutzeri]|jgi:hydroxymethylglutaryl-CoA lyase|uniref:Hydroxymethylglutaryl-CoA lyase n=1 Tax=Stutzerimonas stutzeri TaxID=316 RepID=A0A2N8T102_STUST|nr:hydroxymethylglutaryl-CoA lyase [Stutzerimonas stutzeri]EQM72310.1 hydroxymethylglutaryl-CoA lyase [Stutzerimonas stutzeri MF28]MCQ4251925.1 hydroxymethylglutaryl-CoA lyase [Stutzerimonas stutzeri]PNG08417.1 hydroxymethylglutaryl-CoA lyase [Stutzerimonas stutzeri]
MTKRLYIQDVATRDGFQIEPNFIPTEDKIALIDRLSETGLAKIEVTSFTSPKAIPNLRDAEEVMRGIQRAPGVEYTVLVPNVRGCERALACEVDEINLVMSASDTHGMANLRMTPEQSLAQFRDIIEVTRGSGVFINASLSTTFGCPFEGEVPETRVRELIQRLLDIGVQGITLCDTTGMADPAQVERLCRHATTQWPDAVFTAHFHNTRGMGLANALAAMNAGIDRFDASLGGLGGCPYAPGASGNICTEDLVHMFQRMGLNTGVDLDKLLQCAASLPALVGHDVPGTVLKAGKADRRYPKPKWMDGPDR